MTLKEQINEVLSGGDYLKVSKLTGPRPGFELSYGSMYEAPTINFTRLMELSKLFGTTAIDVDDFANAGCESCDYGSDYGHAIQIYEPTTNTDELAALVDTDLKEGG